MKPQGMKRKSRDNKQKFFKAKNEAKHLMEYGESHPIDDKKNRLEDKLAKRVFDEENDESNIQNESKGQASDVEDAEPDFYEQLLNVFGKKKKMSADSDDSEAEEIEKDSEHEKAAQENDEFDQFDTQDNDEIENDEVQSDHENEESAASAEIDNFARHFFVNFESNDIELLNKTFRSDSKFTWPHIGSFVESKVDNEKFNFIKLDKPFKNLNELSVKLLLQENIPKTMLEATQNENNCLSPFQIELLGLFSTYKDLYYPERNSQNGELIRVAYCTHSLNHVLKTRARIMSHNAKLSLNHTQKDEYRDQGLTRPKVLIVVPFRDCAYRIVNCFINLLFADAKDTGERNINIMNYKRFKKEFGTSEDDLPHSSRKPDDYKETFKGNIDDSFRIGLSITKKSLKLYTEFYTSDIIIASPLGLRLIIGAEGEDERDFDFLSSIDITILDQTEVFLMQNWEHVLHLMSHVHLRPKKDHGVDYSRVKLWILELWSRYYSQLLVFSSTSCSMINGLFNKFSMNYSGKLLMRNEVAANRAAINQVYIQCPQIFSRFNCDNFAQNSDDRFNFFVNKILPKFKEKLMVRTMIYIPSYFDFVRLRNYFRREDIGFSQICEYTEAGKVAKARHIFFYGGRHFLLFTERFHFFHRYTIKGIRHLIFYQPPTYPHFYSELVNSMHLSNQGKKLTTDYSSMSVTVLFNKYDAHSLVSLVGTKTATSLLQSTSDVHMFVTENALV